MISVGFHICISFLQAFRPATLLKRDTNIGVFLLMLQNVLEHPFRRTSENGCFSMRVLFFREFANYLKFCDLHYGVTYRSGEFRTLQISKVERFSTITKGKNLLIIVEDSPS